MTMHIILTSAALSFLVPDRNIQIWDANVEVLGAYSSPLISRQSRVNQIDCAFHGVRKSVTNTRGRWATGGLSFGGYSIPDDNASRIPRELKHLLYYKRVRFSQILIEKYVIPFCGALYQLKQCQARYRLDGAIWKRLTMTLVSQSEISARKRPATGTLLIPFGAGITLHGTGPNGTEDREPEFRIVDFVERADKKDRNISITTATVGVTPWSRARPRKEFEIKELRAGDYLHIGSTKRRIRSIVTPGIDELSGLYLTGWLEVDAHAVPAPFLQGSD